MAGHSKWANIKHRKAAQDAKRSNLFTKLAKDITVAARQGGDPEANLNLRLAIDKAKSANMPKENIERAIKRGTGELKDASQLEEVIYEAYGPGGQIAMLIKATTDNKNRTLSEIKHILGKNGGKFVEGGGVSWQFEQAGSFWVNPKELDQETAEIRIIESGAKDYRKEGKRYNVFTLPQELQAVRQRLENDFEIEKAEIVFLAKNPIEIDKHIRLDYEKLLEALDEQEDVSEVWDNIK